MRKIVAKTSRAEWVIVVLVAVLALASWIHLESSEDVGPGLGGYFGAFVLLGVAVPAARCLRTGLDVTTTRLRNGRRGDPMRQQLQAMSAPGAAALLLPLALAPLMAATLPVAFAAEPDDSSIVGVLAFLVGVVAYLGILLGFLLWMLLGLPLFLLGRVVGRRLGGGPADADDRFGLALGLLLPSVLAFAVALVLSTSSEGGTRQQRQGDRFAALIWLDGGRVDSPTLLWVARVALLGIVAGVVLAIRAGRTRRSR